MKRIGTQRALALYDLNDALIDASNPDVLICNEETVPVLVIPEADVKGCHCKHPAKMSPVDRWCENCGAFKGAFTTRWIKPRILRVRKAKR